MPYFDFHLHPTLKSLFSENTDHSQKFSPWDEFDTNCIPFMLKWCSEIARILRSQANLTQLARQDCNLVCLALYIPEVGMIGNDLISTASKGKMGKYLQKEKIDKIISGNPYQLLRTDDWNTLTNAASFGINDKKVKPIFSAADYDENDTNTIHVVFSVEGCHTLASGLRTFDVDTIIANIDDLRSKLPLLSINVTHLEQSTLCNHAYGILFVDNGPFIPTGKGIKPNGFKVIKHCYENKIMIDVKHMSLMSRWQLYQVRKSFEFETINQPVVATHVGFTGISISEIPRYIYDHNKRRRDKYYQVVHGKVVKYGDKFIHPAFNPSSINLYDEDIINILESGGLIGLSLDKRILGYQALVEPSDQSRPDYPLEEEFISADEWGSFFNGTYGEAFDDGECLTWKDLEYIGPVDLDEYHLRHFMAHLLHLVVVARKNEYDVNKALKQVCIGSDFDGLINPVDCCDTINDLSQLQKMFEDNFVEFAEESGVELPAGFSVKQLSADLFFNNGRDFVFSRLA